MKIYLKNICLPLLPLFLLVCGWSIPLKAQKKYGDTLELTINAITGLQFDLVRFTVSPGKTIKITFVNNDDMGHNLLITTPGARSAMVEEALKLAEQGPALNYIPQSDKILWHIPVTYPGEKKVLSFRAPEKPGIYPYVCTFPGHGFIMYGAMYVGTDMPALEKDENIPEARRLAKKVAGGTDHTHHHKPEALHPYPMNPPFMYRAFSEEAGLISILVHLPHKLSYGWNATLCKLQVAWEGEFVDNTDFWHGHKNAYSKIKGNIFYHDTTSFPFRIGNLQQSPEVDYKGYSLVRKYPEFHYTLNGLDVYELIHPAAGGNGLVRTFRIPKATESVRFVFDKGSGIQYRCSTGKQEGNQILLTGKQATRFTITMTKTKL